MYKYYILCISFLLSLLRLSAQQPIAVSYQQAVQIALKQNGSIQLKKLSEEVASALQKTAYNLPKTGFNAELGNVNTPFFDSKLTVSQSFASPGFYKQQQQLLQNLQKMAVTETQLQKTKVVQMVKQTYVQLQLINKHLQLLALADSVWFKYFQLASLRYQKGESNLLEKATIENLYQQNKWQIQQTNSLQTTTALQLQLLLNQQQPVVITDTLVSFVQLTDTATNRQHPFLQLQQLHTQQAIQQTQLFKKELQPDWFLAATNQSFVGWLMDKNRNERFYNMGNRFTSVQLGMNVSLFTKAQKARIAASEKNEKLAEATANYTLTEWQTQQKQLLEQQKNAWLQLQYFKASALPQAAILMQQANSLYKNGQISYIEWNTAVRNSLQTEWQFAETVAHFNQLGIQLQYLLTDNASINE